MAINVTTTIAPVYDELIEFIVEKITPELILEFKPSESARQRAEELTDKNKAGELTPDERAELEHMYGI